MYDNNLEAILSAFHVLNKRNEKLNYFYEPRFKRKSKDWKRCYIINELENDFKKDVMNYGFSPYIENEFNEQKKDRNIMKYFYVEKYNFSNYIKKMNYLIHNKSKVKENKNQNFIDKVNNSYQYKSMKDKKNFPKIAPKTSQNLSVSNILKERDYHSKSNPTDLKSLSKIVKFNRDNLAEENKMGKKKLNNNDNDSSFNYDEESTNKNFEEINNFENNNLNIDRDKNIMIINNDYIKPYKQRKKFQLFNKNMKVQKIKIKQKKTDKIIMPKGRSMNGTKSVKNFRVKKDIYFPIYNKNKLHSREKSKEDDKYTNINNRKNRNKTKELFLEKLENYSKSIFKTAKKIK